MRIAVVVLALVVSLAAPVSSQQPENAVGRGSSNQPAASDQPANPGAKSVTTHFAPGQRADRHTYRAICDSPKDKDHADLCQQWRVADAAETQELLGSATLLLLLFTVLAAVGAAVGTWYTVRTMRETGERQLRAYVLLDKEGNINLDPKSGVVTCKFLIRNFGQTPARAVRHKARVELLPFPIEESPFVKFPVDIEEGAKKSKLTVAPTMTFWGYGKSEQKFTQAAVSQDSPRACCFGYIQYEDIFGTTRTTKFCYSVKRDAHAAFGVEYAPIDNEAE